MALPLSSSVAPRRRVDRIRRLVGLDILGVLFTDP